jgi:hypothetical protein
MKWPRYCEMLLGLWLLAVPWILNYGDSDTFRTINIAAATGILLLDILSVTLYKRYAHLAVLGIAFGLLTHAYFAALAEATGTQNNIIVALLLLIFAILPTEATLPPPSWREFREKHR